METYYDTHEIVKVIHDFCLFDAEFYQRRYRTKYSEPLRPGYYIVSWPKELRVRRFNEQANFQGPYDCRQDAETFLNAELNHNNIMKLLTLKLAMAVQDINKIRVKKVA